MKAKFESSWLMKLRGSDSAASPGASRVMEDTASMDTSGARDQHADARRFVTTV
jgi:hypothetical protein